MSDPQPPDDADRLRSAAEFKADVLGQAAAEMKYAPGAIDAIAAMVGRAETEGLSLQVISNEWLLPSTDKRDGIGFNLHGTDYWLDRIGRTMKRNNSELPANIVNEVVSPPGFKRAFDDWIEYKKGGPPPIDAPENAKQVAQLFSEL